MAVRDIVKHPAEILRQRAQEVEEITDEILDLLDDLRDTMNAGGFVGFAANQINVALRVIIVKTQHYGDVPIINPEVVWQSRRTWEAHEGCASLPGVQVRVERPWKITLRGMRPDGVEFEDDAEGKEARYIQHEIDHLDGKLIIDYK